MILHGSGGIWGRRGIVVIVSLSRVMSTLGTCNDTVLDGGETDVDCGGTECNRCDFGMTCFHGPDCILGLVCDGGQCRNAVSYGWIIVMSLLTGLCIIGYLSVYIHDYCLTATVRRSTVQSIRRYMTRKKSSEDKGSTEIPMEDISHKSPRGGGDIITPTILHTKESETVNPLPLMQSV